MLEITLNQRMTPRIPLTLEATLKAPGASATGRETHTVNISEGGAFIETDDPLAPGQTLELELVLPDDDRPLNCSARVVWNISPPVSGNQGHPLGMGLEFLKIDDHQRLRRFLQS
ncbi:MAG: PilZ domain-containing protein [Desulfuromonadales bacterium]|nr:PilZ domain-containing protein [Desulfuromonadales bacterium]NIR33301.1 PilZ domain-containing protein [Desulfuromonadales bacterium]NIS43301.1 PilZ domain-containing protein [Desulfuromonadales bacterium]